MRTSMVMALLAWMALGASAVFAETGPLFQFNETAGPHTAGLKVVEQYDYSRTYRRTTDALGREYAGERARPLQILIWYPAEVGNGQRMTVGDYASLLSTETSFGAPTVPVAASEFLAGLSPALAAPLRAVRDAPAVAGRFPVVIYAPGFSSAAWENADLCEYLASHGYVVIASPSMGATTRAMTTDLAGITAQARDISFLIGYASSLANANVSEVAVLGFSWGGLANLFAAARDNRIDALISLDGSMRSSPAFVQQAGDVHPEQMTLPLLSIAGAPMTLEYEERVLNETERQGPNVLNSWTHGDLTAVHLLGFVHWQHASMYQRNELIWQMLFPQMRHADYDRGDAIAGYGWLARYVRAFLDGYLKDDASSIDYLKRTPTENGAPKHFLSASFRAASGRPASFDAFRAEVARRGFAKAAEVHADFQKQSAGFQPDADAMNDWSDELIGLRMVGEASAVLKLNAQIHPRDEGATQRLRALANGAVQGLNQRR